MEKWHSMSEESLLNFAKGYRTLYKEARSIIDFLRTCENNTFYGKQIELLEKSGYKLVKYLKEEKGKSYSSNLGQFRRLGIVELSEHKIINYVKLEGKNGYIFKLNDDWVDTLIKMGENC